MSNITMGFRAGPSDYQINIRPMLRGVEHWPWKHFVGDAETIRYAKRELDHVAKALEHVKGRSVVIQAGGNVGIFPKYLAQYFGLVYTFEPSPDCFVAMCHNAQEANILRFQAALGPTTGGVSLSRARRDGKPNQHQGITYVDGPGPIPQVTIDGFRFAAVDLIYLDIEGGELGALQGARDTIARCRPVLAFELNKNAAYVNVTREDVEKLLVPLGYQPIARYGADEVWIPC